MNKNKFYFVKRISSGSGKRIDMELNNFPLGLINNLKKKNTLGNVLEEVLAQLLSMGGGDNAFVFIEDSFAFHSSEDARSKQCIYIGSGKYHNESRCLDQILDSSTRDVIRDVQLQEKMVCLPYKAIFPFFNENHYAVGVFWVEGVYDESCLKKMDTYCKMAEAVIHNAFLHLTINRFSNDLTCTYNQLRIRYHDIIAALRKLLGTKDSYTCEHSDRVSFYAYRIGEVLNLAPNQMERLGVAGIFHDVGKIGTPDNILLKKGKLTREEFEEIKKHPVRGEEILCTLSIFKEMAPIVRHHHERVDGTGYPDGLRQDEIEIEARIIAVADAFDAMTSDRSYRSHMTIEEARSRLIQGIGTQFDSTAVRIFSGLLDSDQSILNLSHDIFR